MKSSLILAMKPAKNTGFESQPEAFNGIKVRRIGWQILWDEVMPVEAFDFMPRGVVQDQVAALVGIGRHALGEVVQERLKDFTVAVVEDQRGA